MPRSCIILIFDFEPVINNKECVVALQLAWRHVVVAVWSLLSQYYCLRSQRRNININKVTKYQVTRVVNTQRLRYYVWQTVQTGPGAPPYHQQVRGNPEDQLVVGGPGDKMTTQIRSVSR